MNDSPSLNAFYADELRTQHEQVVRRTLRARTPRRRTTRNAIATGLHRLADRVDHDLA